MFKVHSPFRPRSRRAWWWFWANDMGTDLMGSFTGNTPYPLRQDRCAQCWLEFSAPVRSPDRSGWPGCGQVPMNESIEVA